MNLLVLKNLPVAPRLLWILSTVVLLLGGCISSTEVKDIVQQSNYEMLLNENGSSALSSAQPNPPKDTTVAGPNTLARLEAFVDQHPENPAMVSALRLRQAIMYLNNGSYELAHSAFTEVKLDALHTRRDQAIYALNGHLQWWYRYSRMDDAEAFHREQKGNAEAALQALAQQGNTLADAPDARDFFLEMRTWIAMKLAVESKPYEDLRPVLTKAVADYAAVFSPAELQQIAHGQLEAGAQPFNLSTRRILRAEAMLKRLAFFTKNWQATPLDLAPVEFQSYYQAQLPH